MYLQGLSKKAVDETIAKAFKVRNNEKLMEVCLGLVRFPNPLPGGDLV